MGTWATKHAAVDEAGQIRLLLLLLLPQLLPQLLLLLLLLLVPLFHLCCQAHHQRSVALSWPVQVRWSSWKRAYPCEHRLLL